jgi:hypothetical protein
VTSVAVYSMWTWWTTARESANGCVSTTVKTPLASRCSDKQPPTECETTRHQFAVSRYWNTTPTAPSFSLGSICV